MSESSIVPALLAVIAERKANPADEKSYVASLLRKGDPKIVGKIAEEALEVIEAASEPGEDGRAHLVREAADLVFHVMVLLGRHDVPWAEVESELARRFGISGIAEKASRAPSAE
ncbi:phosphoribosyl-ATP diphosphatase [Singulisphaera rosea]